MSKLIKTLGKAVKIMNPNVIKIALLATLFSFIAGCVDINFTGFKIAYPVNSETYIGYTGNEPLANGQGTQKLAQFEITFAEAISAPPAITLNGHEVSSKFAFSKNNAVADASSLKQFLRQGNNTFAVDRSAFGPAIDFQYDGMGPDIVVESADIDANTASLQLKGYLRDFSDLAGAMTLDLVQITGYSPKNALIRNITDTVSITVNAKTGRFDQSIDLSTVYAQGKPYLYSFEACDQFAYCSEYEFVADNEGSEALTLKNAVVVALGQTFVQTVKPLISSTIKTSLDAAPIDARCLKVAGVSPGDPNEGDAGPAAGPITWEDGGMKGRQVTPLFTKKYACGNWDDDRLCGEKRGVVPGKNITQSEFDKYKVANPTANLTDAMFNCDMNADPQVSYFVPNKDPEEDGAKIANLSPFKVDMAGTTYAGYMQHISFYDGDYPNRSSELNGLVDANTPQGSVTMNQFTVLEGNKVHVNLMMTQMYVRLNMTQGYNGMCGFWETPYNVEFPAISLFMPKLSIDGEMSIFKETNGELSIQMADNASVNFVENPKFSELTIQCGALNLPVGGLVDALSGSIKGLIGDMVPGIINQVFTDNLKKLRLGGSMIQPDNGTAFDAFLGIQALGTGSSQLSPSVYDLTTSLDSTVKVTDPDQNAPTILGPMFVGDPIDPNRVFNATSGGDSNISVAVNANMINSMLAALNSTGVTYFTSYKGKTYFGANPNTPAQNQADKNSPTLASVKKDDSRVRLWPDMPPTISFDKTQKQEGQSRAEVKYTAATLYQDKYDGTTWVNKIKMRVHFNLAVEINNDGNGNFTIGAAGPPEFVIDDYVNNSVIQIPKVLLQALINIAMEIGGDILADQKLTFNFNKIISDQLNGQVVEYYSSEDNYTLAEGECLSVDGFNQTTGEAILTPPAGAANSADGKPDLICYTFSFDVATYTAGTTGANNSNLFFQMKLSDARLPPPYAVPRFDLDGDGQLDYRDNCAVSQEDLTAAVNARYPGGSSTMVDENGEPLAGVEDALRDELHTIYSHVDRYGSLTAGEKDWYNTRRAEDSDGAVFDENWAKVLFSNPSQAADFGSVGNLCQSDVDRDRVLDFVDNCPGVFNPGQEVNGTTKAFEEGDVGDACNVRETFVMIRSLGSKLDETYGTGNYQCLSHEYYKNVAGTVDGINHSNSMKTSNGAVVKDCDSADLNQRWHLKKIPGEATKLANLPNATDKAGIYHLFADDARDNANSWQLITQNNGSGELRMGKMNDANRLYSSNPDNYVAGFVLDIDPSTVASTVEREIRHPWILRSWGFLKTACFYYNGNGWGPDIDNDRCASTYLSVGNGGVDDLWFRWGIYIGGTDQLWDAAYPE